MDAGRVGTDASPTLIGTIPPAAANEYPCVRLRGGGGGIWSEDRDAEDDADADAGVEPSGGEEGAPGSESTDALDHGEIAGTVGRSAMATAAPADARRSASESTGFPGKVSSSSRS